MTMVRSLEGWLPNDAPWSGLGHEVLQEQCAMRDLATTGDSFELIQRLLAYKHDNTSDRRRSPWLSQPHHPADYKKHWKEAEGATFQIVRIEDMSGSGRYLNKHFTITDEEGALFTLSFSKEPACTCHAGTAHFRYVNITCVHIIYVMRFVLNSPEYYCWQDAFLSSELESIYRHSHVVHTLLTTGWENPNDQCTICFKELRDPILSTTYVTCSQCGRAIHTACVGAVKRVRQPIQDGQCYICEDRAEWGSAKFSEQRKVQPAVPINTTVTPAVSQPARQAGQHSFQTIFKDEERGSLSHGDVGDKRLDNKTRSTSHCSSSDVSSISSLFDLSSPSQLFGKKEASYSPHYQQPKCQPTSHKTNGQQVSIESRSWPPPSIPSTQPIRPKTANVRMSVPVPQIHTPVPLPAIAFAWKEQKQKKQQEQHTQPNSPVSIRYKPIIADEARYTPSISDKPADSVDRQLSSLNSRSAGISANASSPASPASTSQSPTSGARPAAGSFADNGTATASKSASTIRTRIQNHQRKMAELKQIFKRLAKESKQELEAIKKQHKQELKEKRKIKKKAKRELKKLTRKGRKLQQKAEAEPRHTEESSAE
ncbi:hypothetical protein B0T13DRAFT_538387 [Neurospora crassa]|nr:hypothetical protein B0T13DRAFT_538387 [Neurospora crassa]